MQKTGFNICNSKTNFDKNIDFTLIENEYGFSFPKTYKLFLNTFQVGEHSFNQEFYYDKLENIKTPIFSYYFKNEEIFL